jgi:aryl-alcohol dehydrogenase
MKVHAAIANGASEPFVIAEADLDDPRPDEILVKVEACGICQTDLRVKRSWPQEVSPMVFGHEGAGTVAAVGKAVNQIAPGDKVVMSFRSCGECVACQAGKVAYCRRNRLMNFSGTRPDGTVTMRRNGLPLYGSFFGQSTFASYALATERNVVRVPAGTNLALAAPLGCGIQTGAGTVMNVFRPRRDESLVVFGAGGVGDAAIMAASALGMSTIIAVEPLESRRELASQIGATAVIDSAADDIAEQIHDLTGTGANFAFDTSGRAEVINVAIEALEVNGVLALVASEAPELAIDLRALGGRSIRGVIEGDAVPQRFIPKLLRLHAAGHFPLEKIIRTYSFGRINEAVEDTLSGETVKAVLAYS